MRQLKDIVKWIFKKAEPKYLLFIKRLKVNAWKKIYLAKRNHHPGQGTEYCLHSSLNQCLLPSFPGAYIILTSSIILAVLKVYMKVITKHVFFSVWLILLNIIFVSHQGCGELEFFNFNCYILFHFMDITMQLFI